MFTTRNFVQLLNEGEIEKLCDWMNFCDGKKSAIAITKNGLIVFANSSFQRLFSDTDFSGEVKLTNMVYNAEKVKSQTSSTNKSENTRRVKCKNGEFVFEMIVFDLILGDMRLLACKKVEHNSYKLKSVKL